MADVVVCPECNRPLNQAETQNVAKLVKEGSTDWVRLSCWHRVMVEKPNPITLKYLP